jgi:hypothetical protein
MPAAELPAVLLDPRAHPRIPIVAIPPPALEHRPDQEDPPGAVEHPERERPLLARHLVVIQLHRVDRPAPELVVLGEGAEDGGEEHAGAVPFGCWHEPDMLTDRSPRDNDGRHMAAAVSPS